MQSCVNVSSENAEPASQHLLLHGAALRPGGLGEWSPSSSDMFGLRHYNYSCPRDGLHHRRMSVTMMVSIPPLKGLCYVDCL